MREAEIKKYRKLNEYAEQGGIVIFGSGEDKCIPSGELRQAFAIDAKVYNRSFDNISITEALQAYKEAVTVLAPETVLLHIGETDLASFSENSGEFDHKYLELISAIRAQNKNCRIAVVSMKNHDRNPAIEEMNRHLKYIADSGKCEYGDIAERMPGKPAAAMDDISFIYSIGFIHPLRIKRPLYDLVRILFCCSV